MCVGSAQWLLPPLITTASSVSDMVSVHGGCSTVTLWVWGFTVDIFESANSDRSHKSWGCLHTSHPSVVSHCSLSKWGAAPIGEMTRNIHLLPTFYLTSQGTLHVWPQGQVKASLPHFRGSYRLTPCLGSWRRLPGRDRSRNQILRSSAQLWSLLSPLPPCLVAYIA